MDEVPPNPNSKGNIDDNVGTPRWVKVFGIIALVVIVPIYHLDAHSQFARTESAHRRH